MFGEILGSVLGGLFGGSEQTQSGPQLDPRLAKWVYGEDGNSGLIGDAAKMYQSQMAQGGLNQNQQAGLDYLRQLYMSPFAFSGYNKMGSMAQGIQDKYAQKYGLNMSQPQFNPQMQIEQAPIRSTPIPTTNPFGFVPLQPAPSQPKKTDQVTDWTDRFA